MSRSEILSLARSTYGVNEQCTLVSSKSNVIAAAQPALSLFWSMATPNFLFSPVILERLRLQFTCVTAFATPVVAGRALAFCTLDGLPSAVGVSNNSSSIRKQTLFSEGFSAAPLMTSVSNLTPTGAPPDLDDVFAQVSLAGYGTAGAVYEKEWNWNTGSAAMVSLVPGQVIGLFCPAAMDAGGTFELVVEADFQGMPEDYPP